MVQAERSNRHSHRWLKAGLTRKQSLYIFNQKQSPPGISGGCCILLALWLKKKDTLLAPQSKKFCPDCFFSDFYKMWCLKNQYLNYVYFIFYQWQELYWKFYYSNYFSCLDQQCYRQILLITDCSLAFKTDLIIELCNLNI